MGSSQGGRPEADLRAARSLGIDVTSVADSPECDGRKGRAKPGIRVTVDRVNATGLVAGWQAKELVEECGGRPLWSGSRRAWATSLYVAVDVVALADHESIPVTFTDLSGGGAHA